MCIAEGVVVLLGNGDLTFQSTVAYTGNGFFVSLADMNGDGKLDIVLAGSLQIRFLLGNGDGTFHLSPIHLDVFDPLTQVSVGDVNEDGVTDIVTESDNGLLNGMVHVFLGNGDLTFQPETRFHSGGAFLATSLTVADVNADGKPDIVVSSCAAKRVFCGPSEGGVVSILAGRGTGEFKQAVTYPSGGAFADFATVADVNGDSRPDLVVTDFFTNDVGVLLNTGLYPTSTSLNSSMNPSRQGQAVTFTATVTWVGPTPTGNVTFKSDGAWLGSAMLSGGVATVTKHLTVGTHSIVARYHGDGVAAGQSTSPVLIQVVNP